MVESGETTHEVPRMSIASTSDAASHVQANLRGAFMLNRLCSQTLLHVSLIINSSQQAKGEEFRTFVQCNRFSGAKILYCT